MADPVFFTIELDHVYKSRGGRKPGCATCGESKYADCHMGRPPTLNHAIGMDWRAWAQMKQAWQRVMLAGLEESGLPKGLASVVVECTVCFPRRGGRDEGNLRWMPEKALGDALVAGGYLPDDTFWPVMRYQFGPLIGRHTPGREAVEIVLMPTTVQEAEPFVDPGQLSMSIDD